jgi:hypothetical protein
VASLTSADAPENGRQIAVPKTKDPNPELKIRANPEDP